MNQKRMNEAVGVQKARRRSEPTKAARGATKKLPTTSEEEDAPFFLGFECCSEGAGVGFISTAAGGGGDGSSSPDGAGDGGE